MTWPDRNAEESLAVRRERGGVGVGGLRIVFFIFFIFLLFFIVAGDQRGEINRQFQGKDSAKYIGLQPGCLIAFFACLLIKRSLVQRSLSIQLAKSTVGGESVGPGHFA